MVRISSSTNVHRGDVELLEAVLPLVIDGLRQLTFGSDGNLVMNGVAHSGLRHVAGTHPNVGATYRIRLASAEPSAPIDIEVKHNDSRRIVIDGRQATSQTAFSVELAEPWNPTQLSTVGTVSIARVRLDARSDFVAGRACATDRPRPPVDPAASCCPRRTPTVSDLRDSGGRQCKIRRSGAHPHGHGTRSRCGPIPDAARRAVHSARHTEGDLTPLRPGVFAGTGHAGPYRAAGYPRPQRLRDAAPNRRRALAPPDRSARRLTAVDDIADPRSTARDRQR